MTSYENQREHFERIADQYKDYLRLYRFFNHGSLEGCNSFAWFYWTHTYHYRISSLTGKM